MTHIHTVTTIAHHPDKPVHHSLPRCWGYYFTREEARAGLQISCSDEAGYYTHAVIEKYAPGMYTYALAEEAEWYKWNNKASSWVRILEPAFAKNIINYAIG